MSKLSDLFAQASSQFQAVASTFAQITQELAGGAPVPIPPTPTPVPPEPAPVPPGPTPPGVQFQLTPGGTPQQYQGAVASFSFIAAKGPNGTNINTVYSPGFGGFPGNNVRMDVREQLNGPIIATSGQVSNSDSFAEVYTMTTTIPGRLYYLTITRDLAGGTAVQQVNK